MNTPTDFYFLMPLFGEPIVGGNQGEEARFRRRYDLSGHPTLQRYITYFNHQLYSSQYGNSSNVILAKDNKLPFVKVTKAEYLDKLGEAVERKYGEDKAYATNSCPWATPGRTPSPTRTASTRSGAPFWRVRAPNTRTGSPRPLKSLISSPARYSRTGRTCSTSSARARGDSRCTRSTRRWRQHQDQQGMNAPALNAPCSSPCGRASSR